MRKITAIIASIALAIFLANVCYIKSGLYDEDIIQCNAELLYDVDKTLYNKDLLYFGESSNFTFSPKDSCKKSIAELLSDLNPAKKISAITKGAIHAATYNVLIRRIKANASIKTIIVTLNLRSFGINWMQSDLETNLSRANLLYTDYPPVIKKFLLSFKAYDNTAIFKRKEIITRHYRNDKFRLSSKPFKTVRDWDKEVFDKGILDNWGAKDQKKTDLACHFIKNYAYVLNPDNPRIKDLDEIISFCRKKNIRLVFHILPENYEKAKELCGTDLEILMRSNVAFLKRRYEGKTVFIDNFYLLRDSCFIDRDWPTEHYNYYGRKKIADKITEKLNSLLN